MNAGRRSPKDTRQNPPGLRIDGEAILERMEGQIQLARTMKRTAHTMYEKAVKMADRSKQRFPVFKVRSG